MFSPASRGAVLGVIDQRRSTALKQVGLAPTGFLEFGRHRPTPDHAVETQLSGTKVTSERPSPRGSLIVEASVTPDVSDFSAHRASIAAAFGCSLDKITLSGETTRGLGGCDCHPWRLAIREPRS
jgi:hypothetical protein